jgi:hypothetical protein
MTIEMPRLKGKLNDDGTRQCLWCEKSFLDPCTSQYDSLTCVQRPLEDEDGPTPEEWAALDANARGEGSA